MTQAPSAALVVGATGLVGSHLIDLLLDTPRIKNVHALVRKPLTRTHPKLNVHVVNFEQLEAAAARLGLKADEAYCALGTTIKKAGSKAAFRKVDFEYETAFAKAARAAGARRFALVSSVGADAKSSIFYTQVKGETEDAIRALNFPSLHIFRPGVLLGHRAEARPAEQFAVRLTPLINLALQGPLKIYRGIAAEDVAHAMVKALAHDVPGKVHHYSEMVPG